MDNGFMVLSPSWKFMGITHHDFFYIIYNGDKIQLIHSSSMMQITERKKIGDNKSSYVASRVSMITELALSSHTTKSEIIHCTIKGHSSWCHQNRMSTYTPQIQAGRSKSVYTTDSFPPQL